MTEGPDLSMIHRIDQAQASAFSRISNLLEWISDWMDRQGFELGEKADALDDPMIFMALVKIMRERVDVRELPNLMAAAVIRISKGELEKREG
jgi:hypothetical protein